MAIGTTVKVGWDATKVNRGMRSLKSQFSAMAGVMKNVAKVAAGIGLAFTASTVLYARKFAREMDRIGKLSTRLDESAESIQRIAEAAKIGGTDLEIVVKGIQNFVRNLIDAENGTGEYADAVAELGLNARALVDMPIEKQLLAISDAYSRAGGSARALAAMQDLLGRGGPELAAMVAQGPEALAKQLGEATVVSERTVRAMEQVNDAITRTSGVVRGAFAESIAGIIPLIEQKLPDLEAKIKEFGKIASGFIAEGLAGNTKPIERVFEFLGKRLAEIIFAEVARATIAGINYGTQFAKSGMKGGVWTAMEGKKPMVPLLQIDDIQSQAQGMFGSNEARAAVQADIMAEKHLQAIRDAARRTAEVLEARENQSPGYYPLEAIGGAGLAFP